MARPCSRAHAQPGSACHPPNSRRWAAAISQHVASRMPSAASRAAVRPDHITHRGRSTSSALPSPAASPSAVPPAPVPVPAATVQAPSAVARPTPSAGETTNPTRSPRLTPPCRNDVTRSAPDPVTSWPCHGPTCHGPNLATDAPAPAAGWDGTASVNDPGNPSRPNIAHRPSAAAAHPSTANFGTYSARSVFLYTIGQLAWETVLPVLRNYPGQMPGLADCGYEGAGHAVYVAERTSLSHLTTRWMWP